MPEHVVIIGSGPAGFAAAIYAARANLHPLLFEGAETEENRVSGTLPLGQLSMTTEVENYPGFPVGLLHQYIRSALPKDKLDIYLEPLEEHPHAVTGPELMNLMRQQAMNFGTRIITDDIVDVDFSSKPYKLQSLSGETYQTHTVILATGARANYLGLPSEHQYKNRGVSACAVCDGALPRFRNKPLVVVGGGDSAVEEATYLSKYASTVHMILRRDAFRASKIMQERALTNPKIQMHYFREVDEVLGSDKEGVNAIRLKCTKGENDHLNLPASGLFLAIGHTPNTAFLKGKVETNPAGYIKYTQPFRTYTSVEGVFAAGDVADDYYRQAITSAGTGCMAALDAERYLAAQGI